MLTNKAKGGAAPMAHLSVHGRLDNADQLKRCLLSVMISETLSST
jgi:hypothetical protein